MKTIGISIALWFCVGSAAAQSLGDVAKKEKERREANAEAGKTAVVVAEGSGEVRIEETESPEGIPETDEAARAAELERKLEEANEKLDELLERTSEPEPEKEERPAPPTAKERADGYAQRISELRSSYPQTIGRCTGGALATVENDLIVAMGDTAACEQAEAMRKEYDALYHKIWAIEGASILKRNIPKKLDPNRA